MLKKIKTTFFHHFTDRASSAMSCANQHVESQRNQTIEPEHFIMGLLVSEAGVGIHCLKSLDIDLKSLQSKLEKIISENPQLEAIIKIRPSARMASFLRQVREEALSLDHNYLGTEHFVLAMFRLRDEFSTDLIPE